MTRLFGTDGIRGKAGEFPLDVETIERIGYLTAIKLKEIFNRRPSIIIGRDTRESGEWIEQAICRGLSTGGATIHSAGIITTPGIAHITQSTNADAGIVITASHNPFEDNGIKIFRSDGRKLNEEIERYIESEVASHDFPIISGKPVGENKSLKHSYITFLRDEIAAGLDLNGMTIALDCSEGASFEIAPELFRSLGANVVAIHDNPNGKNINLNCGSQHTEHLQQKVKEINAAIGLAFDGDADRLIAVDDRGESLDGDGILFIISSYLKDHDKSFDNKVIATVMSNFGLEQAFTKLGIELIRTSVGDKYVLDELLKTGALIGGEQSGHIIFPKISLAGDGLITAIEILRVMKNTGKSPSELMRDFEHYPQIILNVHVPHKYPIENYPAITDSIKNIENELGNKGRILVRYSGTENKLRIMIEATNKELITQQAESLAEIVRTSIT